MTVNLNRDNKDDCNACGGSGIILWGDHKGDDCKTCGGKGWIEVPSHRSHRKGHYPAVRTGG